LTLESSGETEGDLTVGNGGLIEGGAGGAAIALLGGVNNEILNDGDLDPNDEARIQTAGGVLDTVITGTSGNDNIINRNGAYILGSVALGDGVNNFLNESGALYDAGTLIGLGGGTFTNNAFLSIGGLGSIMNELLPGDSVREIPHYGSTRLEGDFVQGASGHLLANVNFTTGGSLVDYADLFHVTGTATLNGFVTLAPSSGAAKPGAFSIRLLKADSITDQGIQIYHTFTSGTPSRTIVFKPELRIDDESPLPQSEFDFAPQSVSDDLLLEYDVNYSPDGLSNNQSNYSSMVNDIQTQGMPSFEPIASALFHIADETEYRRALDSLTGEAITQAQSIALESRSRHKIEAMAQHRRFVDRRPDDFRDDVSHPTSSFWVSGTGWRGAHEGGYESPSLHDYDAASSRWNYAGVAFGSGYKFDNDFDLSWMFDHGQIDYAVPDRFSKGHVNQSNLSVALSRFFGKNLYLQGLSSASYETGSQDRFALGEPVSGDFDAYAYGGAFEMGFVHQGRVNFYTAFHMDRHTRGAFSEDDVTWGNHYYRQTALSQQAMLGVRFHEAVETRSGNQLAVYGNVSGIIEFETAREMSATPLAAPGFSYDNKGLSAPGRRFSAGVGIAYNLTDMSVFSAEINAIESGISEQWLAIFGVHTKF